MALTPEQIQAFNSVTGWNTPTSTQGQASTSRADQIRQLGTQATAKPATPVAPEQPSLMTRLGSDLQNRGENIASTFMAHSPAMQQDQSFGTATKNAVHTGIQIGGQIAGGVGDILNESVRTIPGAGGILDNIGKNLATQQSEADPNSPGAKVISSIVNWYKGLSPDAQKDVESGGNLAGLVAGGEGEAAAKEVAPTIKAAAGDAFGAIKNIGTKSPEVVNRSAWDIVKPTLSNLEEAEARKVPGQITDEGFLKTTKLNPIGKNKEMLDVATPYLSDVKSSANAVPKLQSAIGQEADKVRESLRNAPGTWSEKNLKGELKKINVDSPEFISVKSDATNLNKFNNFKNAVVKLAEDTPKTQEGKLDLRQGFDSIVKRAFPKIYEKDSDMLPVVRAFRSTLNKFTETGLPEGKLMDGTSFSDALRKQTLLYDAVDNAATNAVKEGKVGTNILTRAESAIKKHPVITGLGAYETAKHIGSPMSGL